ncbi:hypothetical protein PUN28_005328 [Cardiocondyla obscurior]|uniref:Secreted protein n=1 Tax=Cardiocondyla obscurior TaxID=286306 RepID=A0AAW2GFX6_9HYME
MPIQSLILISASVALGGSNRFTAVFTAIRASRCTERCNARLRALRTVPECPTLSRRAGWIHFQKFVQPMTEHGVRVASAAPRKPTEDKLSCYNSPRTSCQVPLQLHYVIYPELK